MSDVMASLITSGDTLEIARYFKSDLNVKTKAEALHALKKRLLDASLGSEEEQLSWLKALFCVSPLMDTDISADEVIRLFSFLHTELYPEIWGSFPQDLLVTFLSDVELTLKHISELIQPSTQQHDSLLHLQGKILSQLGYDLTLTNKRNLAREKLTDSLDIMKNLVSKEPTNTGYNRTLSILFENFGNLEVHLSYFLASACYQDSSKIREKLVEMDPDNIGFILLLADSYFQIGDVEDMIEQTYEKSTCDVYFSDGIEHHIEVITADEWFRRGYLLCKKLIAMKPEDCRCQRALSRAYERIGDRRLNKYPAKALRWYLKAHIIKKKHLDNDSNSRVKLDDYWRCCNRLIRAFEETENMPQAIFWCYECLELAERLYAMDQTNFSSRFILAVACLNLAQELEKSYPGKARELYIRSNSILQSMNIKGLFSRYYLEVMNLAHNGLERIKSADSEDSGGH